MLEGDAAATAPMAPEGEGFAEGTVVAGRYVIGARLGRGAMAEVFEARDAQLDRKVALKSLSSTEARPELSSVLWHEALVLGKLSHPNVVQVYDVGMEDGRAFVVMELVDGQSLERWLATPRGWREVLGVFVQAAHGLAAAHASGIIHRDFKPANVMIGRDGRVRVADFGIATLTGRAGIATARAGTPFYMAPEQYDGEATAQVDQYALCVALYHAWCGMHPYSNETERMARPAAVKRPAHDRAAGRLARDRGASPSGEASSKSPIETAAAKPSEPLIFDGSIEPAPVDPKGVVPAWAWRAVVRGVALEPAERHASIAELVEALGRDAAIRRRRVAIAAGGATAVAIAAGAVVIMHRPEAADPCERAADRLDTVWNDGARTAVNQTFAASALPYANDTATRAVGAIDGLAGDWKAMRIDACRATAVRGEQSPDLLDRRMRCLDVWLAELHGLVDIFQMSPPDRAVIDGAVRAVGKLPPLASCADAQALSARIAPPADPEVRRRVDELAAQIARVDATLKAGKLDRIAAQIEPLETAARATGWPSVVADALYVAGSAKQQLGDFENAEVKLREAAVTAARAHDDPLAARALGAVVFALIDRGLFEPALVAARDADILAARASPDAFLEAKAHDQLGYAYWKLTRFAEAKAAFERAIATFERARGSDDIELAPLLNNYANALFDAGEITRAAELQKRALAILRARLGPEHPMVGTVLNNLGNTYLQNSDLPAAKAAYDESLAIKNKVLPGDHPSIAMVIHNLGNVAMEADRLDDAARLYADAFDRRLRALGPDHPNVVQTEYALARLRREQGRPEEALALQRSVIDKRTRRLGADHNSVADALDTHGVTLIVLGRFDEAEVQFQRALAIHAKAAGADGFDVATSTMNLAFIYRHTGKCATARPLLARVLAIYDRTRAADWPGRANPIAIEAACAGVAGDRPAALAGLEKADRIVAVTEDTVTIARIRFELAQLHGGERGGKLAREAQAVFERRGHKFEAAAVRAWLLRTDVRPARQ